MLLTSLDSEEQKKEPVCLIIWYVVFVKNRFVISVLVHVYYTKNKQNQNKFVGNLQSFAPTSWTEIPPLTCLEINHSCLPQKRMETDHGKLNTGGSEDCLIIHWIWRFFMTNLSACLHDDITPVHSVIFLPQI